MEQRQSAGVIARRTQVRPLLPLLSVGNSPALKKSSLKEIDMKREELEAMGLTREQIDIYSRLPYLQSFMGYK